MTGLEIPSRWWRPRAGRLLGPPRRVHRQERRDVSAVRSGEVVVAEWQTRADGTRDRTQTVIRLPREAALNLEE